jgi:hypothetical protein
MHIKAHKEAPNLIIDPAESRLQRRQFISREHTGCLLHVAKPSRVVRHNPQQLRRPPTRGQNV